MKIGIYHANTTPHSGGSNTFVEGILKALFKTLCRHEIYYFYYGKKIQFDEKTATFIPLSHAGKLTSRVLRYVNKAYGSPLRRAALKHNIELMWFLYGHEDVNIPYVTTVLDLNHRIYPFFPEVNATGHTWEDREKHYRSVLPRAAYIITGTESGKDEIVRFYNIDAKRVKVLSFPTMHFNEKQSFTSADIKEKYNISMPFLYYPAQFWPHKNHITILKAMKILRENYSLEFSIVFTGSDKGNLKYIKEKAVEFGLNKCTHFLGFVSEKELIGLYKNSFAMVYASFFGPDNLPPLEAFALGCPVIASEISGAKEQLGDAALFFDPRRENEIAGTIKRLSDNLKLRETLIEKGRLRAQKWTAENYVDGMLEIIDDFEPYRRCWNSREGCRHT